jgi:hypothetical protein
MLNLCHPTRKRLRPQLKSFTCPVVPGNRCCLSSATFGCSVPTAICYESVVHVRNYSMPTTNHSGSQASRRWLRITLVAASDLITACRPVYQVEQRIIADAVTNAHDPHPNLKLSRGRRRYLKKRRDSPRGTLRLVMYETDDGCVPLWESNKKVPCCSARTALATAAVPALLCWVQPWTAERCQARLSITMAFLGRWRDWSRAFHLSTGSCSGRVLGQPWSRCGAGLVNAVEDEDERAGSLATCQAPIFSPRLLGAEGEFWLASIFLQRACSQPSLAERLFPSTLCLGPSCHAQRPSRLLVFAWAARIINPRHHDRRRALSL